LKTKINPTRAGRNNCWRPIRRAGRAVLIIALAMLAGWPAAAGLKITGLRTEYLVNPLALDERQPRFEWRLESDERGQGQSAYRLLVASSPAKLARGEGDLWDSGLVKTSAASQIAYAGRPLTSRQQAFWKVKVWDANWRESAWSAPASWSMGLLRPEDWQAQWISFRDASVLHTNRGQLHLPPARHYRREFQAAKPIRRAMIYASALGLYELELNGQRVGDAFFTPGWTDYRRRVYYQAYDVTSQVRRGANALGATVADGWYAGYVAYGLLVGYGPHKTGRNIYGKTPALLAQLEIEYTDGSREVIATDANWRTTDAGPIREADFLMGEFYDAHRELPGWSRPGFDDRGWTPAIRAEENGSLKAPFYEGDKKVSEKEFGFIRPARMEAYPAPPVRHIQELKPVAVTEPKPGVYIFNLGQNFAGNVRLKVRGPAGTKITLRYGEMLHPDGRLMTENLRKARATDYYLLKGDPKGEVWTPRFTFHGFQYVEVTGYPGKPGVEAITGLVMHSDTPLTSGFECSDPMANRLFQNIVWTQRANFLELPTDCPQRDEREGWMGDAQIYASTATYNADVAAFFNKWLREVEEAQLPGGAYPDYCPWPFQHGKAFAAAWTDAGIIVPYTIWKVYGDTRLIERLWPSMTRFMDWRRQCSPDLRGRKHPDANTWGDWLNLNEPTPIEFIDAAYFKWDANLMSQMARAIGRTNEANEYYGLQAKIAAQFARDFRQPGGLALKVDTQTAYALAIDFGLWPSLFYDRAAQILADKIARNDYRMATGFLGTKPLLPALSAHGQHDLAVRLFQSRRFPSWGFEVEQGATTIWERWDSFTKEHGFNGAQGNQNASMNSFSHYSFGAVGEWMFRTLAGIDTDGPGYRRILIRPLPPRPDSNPERPPIHWVKAHYDSPAGRIVSAWKLENQEFTLAVTIPPNTTATVWVPMAQGATLTESGRPLTSAKGVGVARHESGCAVLSVGSGQYHFQVRH